jgi:hypothetical protein
MKRFTTFFLCLLLFIPVVGSGATLDMSEGMETSKSGLQRETKQYLSLPGVSLTSAQILALDANIKAIKYGAGLTLSGVTVNTANYGNGLQFLTNSSIDLRPYVGFYININNGLNFTGLVGSVGTVESLGTERISSWGNETNSNPFETFTSSGTDITQAVNSSGGGRCSTNADSDLTHSALYKMISNITVNSGTISGYKFGLSSAVLGFSPAIWSAVLGAGVNTWYIHNDDTTVNRNVGIWGTGNIDFSANGNSFKQVLGPNSNGVWLTSYIADPSFNYNTLSATITITSDNRPKRSFLTIGDSRTALNMWQSPLLAFLQATDTGYRWGYNNKGVGSTTVAMWVSTIAGVVASVNENQRYCLFNLGVNELVSMPTKSTWEANYQTLINTVATRWPTIRIYISYPWGQGYDTNAATMHGWINDLIAANPTTVFAGDDEAVWQKGSDNGVTMGILHYTAAGDTEKANQMKTVLGY